MPDKNIHVLHDFSITVSDRHLYHRMGYGSGLSGVTDTIRHMVNEQRKHLSELLKPAAVYRILDHADTNLHPIFDGARKVALCVCTIGSGMESTSRDLIERHEMLNGFILDCLGSEAAEEVARISDRRISEKARSMGLWPSKRFSPGYGAWDIREQAFIFASLPADRIGVTLSESSMMSPRKSVSFRINLYADPSLTTRRFD